MFREYICDGFLQCSNEVDERPGMCLWIDYWYDYLDEEEEQPERSIAHVKRQ